MAQYGSFRRSTVETKFLNRNRNPFIIRKCNTLYLNSNSTNCLHTEFQKVNDVVEMPQPVPFFYSITLHMNNFLIFMGNLTCGASVYFKTKFKFCGICPKQSYIFHKLYSPRALLFCPAIHKDIQ